MTHVKANFGTINNILDEILGNVNNAGWNRPSSFSPMVNVCESDHAYFIDIVAPGVQKSDFSINIENELLTISYEKESTATTETKKYHRKDFTLGSFKRSFNVQQNVDLGKIEAAYENGILTVTLPKKKK